MYNFFIPIRISTLIYVYQMEECIGALIAVDCGHNGYFQGKLVELDLKNESKAVFLSNAFKLVVFFSFVAI